MVEIKFSHRYIPDLCGGGDQWWSSLPRQRTV